MSQLAQVRISTHRQKVCSDRINNRRAPSLEGPPFKFPPSFHYTIRKRRMTQKRPFPALSVLSLTLYRSPLSVHHSRCPSLPRRHTHTHTQHLPANFVFPMNAGGALIRRVVRGFVTRGLVYQLHPMIIRGRALTSGDCRFGFFLKERSGETGEMRNGEDGTRGVLKSNNTVLRRIRACTSHTSSEEQKKTYDSEAGTQNLGDMALNPLTPLPSTLVLLALGE